MCLDFEKIKSAQFKISSSEMVAAIGLNNHFLASLRKGKVPNRRGSEVDNRYKELAEMMRGQFELIWKLSKPIEK